MIAPSKQVSLHKGAITKGDFISAQSAIQATDLDFTLPGEKQELVRRESVDLIAVSGNYQVVAFGKPICCPLRDGG
jgi:hypothetical protein